MREISSVFRQLERLQTKEGRPQWRGMLMKAIGRPEVSTEVGCMCRPATSQSADSHETFTLASLNLKSL